MAGSDQSVNLSGMLNQIAGVIGEGIMIDGKNAGAALGQQIGNAFKPKVDPSNPQSYQEYAEWAERNGKPKEAENARAEYTRLMERQRKGEALAAGAQYEQAGNAAAGTGDVGSIEKLRESLAEDMKAAAQRGDWETLQILQQQSKNLLAQGDAASVMQKQQKVNGILKMEAALEAGEINGIELEDKQKMAMQEAIDRAMQDDTVRKQVSAGKLQQYQVEEAERQQAERVKFKEQEAQLNAAQTPEEIDALIEKGDMTQEAMQLANYRLGMMDRAAEREAAQRNRTTAVLSEEGFDEWQASIDQLPSGGDEGPGPREVAQRELDTVRRIQDSGFVEGPDGRKVWQEGAKTRTSQALERAERNVSQLITTTAQSNMARRQATEAAKDEKVAAARIAAETGPSNADIAKYMRKPDKDGKGGVDREQAKALAQQDLDREYKAALKQHKPEEYRALQKKSVDANPKSFVEALTEKNGGTRPSDAAIEKAYKQMFEVEDGQPQAFMAMLRAQEGADAEAAAAAAAAENEAYLNRFDVSLWNSTHDFLSGIHDNEMNKLNR